MDAVVDRQALKIVNKARTRRLVGRVLMIGGVASSRSSADWRSG